MHVLGDQAFHPTTNAMDSRQHFDEGLYLHDLLFGRWFLVHR
jgi:hypothetical protein